ncbi:hypothetical protein Nepgr_031378 [Nepenthes gracilis]|uniref:Uncharacterized protein n=1 Tax=Nepenthes gracilis TaxID=150966 RepID=A0AAD3Y6S2_NEPGR|nr:hypothetical protein Nepgr_031378 [Nepenthes gracilis]
MEDFKRWAEEEQGFQKPKRVITNTGGDKNGGFQTVGRRGAMFLEAEEGGCISIIFGNGGVVEGGGGNIKREGGGGNYGRRSRVLNDGDEDITVKLIEDVQKIGSLSNNTFLKLTSQQSVCCLGLCSQLATGQHCSPVVFPEKCGQVKASKPSKVIASGDALLKG